MLHKYIPCDWSTATIEDNGWNIYLGDVQGTILELSLKTMSIVSIQMTNAIVKIINLFFAAHVIVVQPSGSFMRILAKITDPVSPVITGTNTNYQSYCNDP